MESLCDEGGGEEGDEVARIVEMISSGEGSVDASFLGRPGGRFSSSESLTKVVFLEGRHF